MPDPSFDPRQESMKFVGAVSFEGDPICFGPTETRPLPGAGSPLRDASDSDDSGKAAVVVEGATGKELMNFTSSSSSSTGAETQDMYNLASGSSSQHDEAEDTTDDDTTDDDTMDDNTTDVPEAVPMNESDAHLYWGNREPRLSEDTLEQADISPDLGNYECMRLMALPEESQHDAYPHYVQRPEDLLMPSTPIVTFQVPGFSMGLAGGIAPFAEWQFVEDPDDVGLENLDIFMNP